MAEWQTMDTARKIDGDVVLGIILGATCVMEWSDAHQCWFYAYSDLDLPAPPQPTKWMPLPDPE